MRGLRWHLLFALLAINLAAGGASAQPDAQRERVAVLELGNPAQLEPQEVAYLTDIVREVARLQMPGSRFTIMTRENITDLLGDRALADCQGDCAVETGRNLGAVYVVSGEVKRFADELRVTLTLHNTRTANLEKSVRLGAADVKGLESPLETEGGALFESLRRQSGTVPGGTTGTLGEGGDAWAAAAGADVVVRFESEPSGAMVEIDGVPICETPCSRPLPPGATDVALKLPKYVPWSQLVEVKDGMATVRATLEPNFGWISITTDPAGLPVELDGTALGPSPITRHETTLGAHEIWVRAEYYKAKGERIVIDRAEHEQVTIAPIPVNGGLKVQAVDEEGNAISGAVLIDGVEVGRTWATLTLQAGPHDIEVRADASRWTGKLTVPAEEVLTQDVTISKLPAVGPGGKNSVGMTMVRIEPGRFRMGSPASESERDNDESLHEVILTHPFLISTTEVTQGQWRTVMGSNPSDFKGSDELPVESVTWVDCVEFCNKLSAKDGLTPAYSIDGQAVTWNKTATGYRLPTEAEWEYACRAGTSTRFNLGDGEGDLKSAGWYSANSDSKTHPVGQKRANAWGLFDMHGNVWEWCWDWYGEYSGSALTDPSGPVQGAFRVLRGGSWHFDARRCRSAFRGYNDPGLRYWNRGFRVLAGSAGQ